MLCLDEKPNARIICGHYVKGADWCCRLGYLMQPVAPESDGDTEDIGDVLVFFSQRQRTGL